MSFLTYTKRCIIEFASPDGLATHDNNVEYVDWYTEQINNDLGVYEQVFAPFKYIGPTTAEVLCVNQSQAEDLVATIVRHGEELGEPITATTILDFSGTIESFDPDPRYQF